MNKILSSINNDGSPNGNFFMINPKKRIILVANRLPITSEKLANGQFKIQPSSGGLVSGLREIHHCENSIWVGYGGIPSTDPNYKAFKEQLYEQRLISVDLTAPEYDAYYNNACNNIIWPLFHYFTADIHPSSADWQAYEFTNQQFAKTVLAIAEPGDQIWVHDYQLMFLPRLLRQGNPDLSIAYFHHIPFPASEIFRILQPRTEILQGLLGADIIGFHTYDYLRHFLTSVTRLLGCHTQLDEIIHQGRRIKVVAQPLGVDVQMIKQEKENVWEQEDVLQLAREIGNCTVLLGLDRLDYTKGIPERLMAFRQFLKKYPNYIGKVIFIQISVPSRINIPSYSDLRATVEQLVGQINGEFGSVGYSPVQYLYRSFSKDEIIAFYKLARVALITPLRDGLNLVCKEYVAARDDDDGVLILSEMAGAAAEMGEAVLINPYDIDGFAEAIHFALTMNTAERHRRMVQLRNRIIEFDNMAWLRTFTQSWEEIVKKNHIHSTPLRDSEQIQIIKQITASRRCFIFLDYDGTLIASSNRPEALVPSNDCLQLLTDLGQKKSIELILMTDRTYPFCKAYFQHLPAHVIAEHGAFFYMNTEKKAWKTMLGLEEFAKIENDIIRLLKSYSYHLPGAYIERRQFSIIWDYRQADPLFANTQARDLSAALGQLLENTPFMIHTDKKTLEIRHFLINKGYALEKVLQELGAGANDIIITIGDDEGDEAMYQLHRAHNTSIHVGSPNIFAKYHLPTPSDTQQFLREITQALTQPMEIANP